MNELLELIDKGIPISTPLEIYYYDIKELSNDKDRFKKIITKEFDKYINYIKGQTIECDIYIFKTLCIISNSETLEKEIHFSPDAFINSLLFNLNVDNICKKKLNIDNVSPDQITEILLPMMNERLEILENISSEKSLKRQFPMLYEKYIMYQNFYNKAIEIHNYLEDNTIPTQNKIIYLSNMKKDFEKHGAISWEDEYKKSGNFNLKNFCQEYIKAFRFLIKNRENIMEYLYNTPISLKRLNIDKEKLELYIAANAMKKCEVSDSYIQQSFIYFVSDYFNRNKDKKYSDFPKIRTKIENNDNINRSSQEILVTPKSLYDRYKKFIKNHPNIKIVDFSKINLSGMNLEETERFMYYYLSDLQANWEIIPDVECEIEVSINSFRKRKKTEEEKKYHEEVLLDLLIEKKELYGRTTPFFRIKGKNTFDGYIGFIYPNGKVILDKFYDNEKSGKIAEDKAIYVMNIEDFYRLSQFPRRVLMKDSKVKRYYHNGSWQDRILSEANSGSDRIDITERELSTLIKKRNISI